MLASIVGHWAFFHACKVVFYLFVLLEVFSEGVLVQVRFQREDFFRNFLVFPLDTLQFGLPLVEVQALCFEIDLGN